MNVEPLTFTQRKHKVAMMIYLESTMTLLAQRVLADGNDLFVLQKFFSFGADVSQVVGHQNAGQP